MMPLVAGFRRCKEWKTGRLWEQGLFWRWVIVRLARAILLSKSRWKRFRKVTEGERGEAIVRDSNRE